MLQVEHLSRSYGPVRAVDDVSFSIGPGEIVGLLGHNGAGKTTIMKMISGYLEPDSGTVRLDGVNLADEPDRVKRSLGYLPENLPIYPEMSVADYLDYAAVLKGLDEVTRTAEIRRVIAATELADKLLAPIATLSRGYKQRVGVAQALIGKPRLLILDEPTNGLDPEQTRHMRQLIRDIAASATVILSTHIMQEVDAVCSRVLMVRSGRLVVDEQLHELRRTRRLIVRSNCPADRAASLFSIDGVLTVDAAAGRVELAAAADEQAVAATLAQRIVAEGFELYALQPEQRDLESLFRAANADQDVTEEQPDAA